MEQSAGGRETEGRADRGTARPHSQSSRTRTKMCSSRAGSSFYIHIRMRRSNHLGCGKCQNWHKTKQKGERRERLPCRRDDRGPTGWTWSSVSGQRWCGAAAAFRPIATAALFLEPICAFKNTSLDTHKPTVAFPEPTEMHTFLRKTVFFPPATKRLQEDRSCFCARFFSSIHEERRGEDDR